MLTTSPTSSWSHAFTAFAADVPTGKHTQSRLTSAAWLRSLMRSGLLDLTVLRDHTDRFFDAHRLLSAHATDVGPGLGIRMTVQYNLFAGTVLGCGTAAQVATLQSIQREGQLGCFALTEVFAGVHSGLVVQTTATFGRHPTTRAPGFFLDTPTPGAHKNWISQGMLADWAVVVADLRLPSPDGSGPVASHGPHAFLVRLRAPDPTAPEARTTLPDGVTASDMGAKTVGNDLDNARLAFERWWVPLDALLGKHAHVDATGRYVCTSAHPGDALEAVGQRLHTGRVVIATSALEFAHALRRRTQKYTDTKPCWTPFAVRGERPLTLSNVPHLHTLYAEMGETLDALSTKMRALERALSRCVDRAVSPELGSVVAAAKVRCVEEAIRWCGRLQQQVGSYALRRSSGFGELGYLQCCKFAEGDTRVLLMKLARDRYRQHQLARHRNEDGGGASAVDQETMLCWELDGVVARSGWAGFAQESVRVERLAQMVVDRLLADFPADGSPVARL